MYCNICPKCGAHLDPGEPCDCREEQERKEDQIKELEKLFVSEENGQLKMVV